MVGDYFVLHKIHPSSQNVNELKSQQIRENFDKTLAKNVFITPVQRGDIVGGKDTLCPGTLLANVVVGIVSNDYAGVSTYAETTDYLVVEDSGNVVIDWSPGGSAPVGGAMYWVQFTYYNQLTFSGNNIAHNSPVTITFPEGFNPETRIRNSPSEIAGIPDTSSLVVEQLLFQAINVNLGNNNKCRNIKVANSYSYRYCDLLPGALTHKVYGDASTGTETNFASYIFYPVDDGVSAVLNYEDDMATDLGGAARKFDIDVYQTSGVSYGSVSGYYIVDVANGGYIDWYIPTPGELRNVWVQITGGGNGHILVGDGRDFHVLGTAAAARYLVPGNFGLKDAVYIRYLNDSGSGVAITDIQFQISWYHSGELPIFEVGTSYMRFCIQSTDNGASPSSHLAVNYSITLEAMSLANKVDKLSRHLHSVANSHAPQLCIQPPDSQTILGGRKNTGGMPWTEVNAIDGQFSGSLNVGNKLRPKGGVNYYRNASWLSMPGAFNCNIAFSSFSPGPGAKFYTSINWPNPGEGQVFLVMAKCESQSPSSGWYDSNILAYIIAQNSLGTDRAYKIGGDAAAIESVFRDGSNQICFEWSSSITMSHWTGIVRNMIASCICTYAFDFPS